MVLGKEPAERALGAFAWEMRRLVARS